jgi:hypothetical protein
VKTKLRTIAAAAFPVVALATGAMSFESRAETSPSYVVIDAADEPLATFVGKPAYDESGASIGFIHEVVVDPAPGTVAVALVTRADGETLALPLGPPTTVASLVHAREAIALAKVIPPVLVGPAFAAESRGS